MEFYYLLYHQTYRFTISHTHNWLHISLGQYDTHTHNDGNFDSDNVEQHQQSNLWVWQQHTVRDLTLEKSPKPRAMMFVIKNSSRLSARAALR